MFQRLCDPFGSLLGILLVLFSSLSLWAAELQELQLTVPNESPIELAVYHNPGAPVIMLVHGFAADYNTWAHSVGKGLANTHGYTVIMPNMRNTSGFEKRVITDIDHVYQYAREHLGEVKVVVGHSMGAVMSEQWAAGLSMDERGVVFYDEDKARRIGAEVVSIVWVAGPVDIVNRKHVGDIVGGSVFGAISEFWSTLFKLKYPGLTIKKVFRSISHLFSSTAKGALNGVVKLDNLNKEEVKHMIRQPDPARLVGPFAADLTRFGRKGFQSPRGLDYSDARHFVNNVLYVAADTDTLAHPNSIYKKFETRHERHPENSRLLHLEKTGHLDAIVGERAAAMLNPFLVVSANNPTELGSAGTVHVAEGMISSLKVNFCGKLFGGR
tara:strand:- start:16567 stop:17715 length:1149 start_codon:yes stop_codon:yes gene_type:complete